MHILVVLFYIASIGELFLLKILLITCYIFLWNRNQNKKQKLINRKLNRHLLIIHAGLSAYKTK